LLVTIQKAADTMAVFLLAAFVVLFCRLLTTPDDVLFMPIPAQPMEATAYVTVTPPAIVPSDPQSVAALRTQVTLQVQGDPAIFDAKIPAKEIALAFAAAYEVATQAILRLDDGRSMILFDHETRELMPDEPADDAVWTEILRLQNKITAAQDVAAPAPEADIDLSAIWSRVIESDDVVARTKLFLKSLAAILEPAMTIRLHGEVPALALLSAIYLSRPSGYTVEYQDAAGATITLFAK
jgi:hypothetical protein